MGLPTHATFKRATLCFLKLQLSNLLIQIEIRRLSNPDRNNNIINFDNPIVDEPWKWRSFHINIFCLISCRKWGLYNAERVTDQKIEYKTKLRKKIRLIDQCLNLFTKSGWLSAMIRDPIVFQDHSVSDDTYKKMTYQKVPLVTWWLSIRYVRYLFKWKPHAICRSTWSAYSFRFKGSH